MALMIYIPCNCKTRVSNYMGLPTSSKMRHRRLESEEAGGQFRIPMGSDLLISFSHR